MLKGTKKTMEDARNKLETVYKIIHEFEKRGEFSVSTDLIKALLMPARIALKEDEMDGKRG